MFVGRAPYLSLLSEELDLVRETGVGRFVLIRGRRRVGKSRLVEEFLRKAESPSIYFTASRQAPDAELAAFADAMGASGIAGGDLLSSAPSSWEGALTAVAALARSSGPLVVVVDEFPYLLEGPEGSSIEGTFQKMWDRLLQDAPVLLIVIGSDLAVMEALTTYARPLYGRPTKIVRVRPFSPLEVAEMLRLGGREALEAYLVVGGFPLVARSWRRGATLRAFLTQSLSDPTSPLIVDGERSVAAEFPPHVHARAVLTAIGRGERTFTTIGRATGLSQTSLARALHALVDDKGIVVVDAPLSAKPSRERRYRIADPYLRFWITFVEPALPEIERDRGRAVVTRVMRAWPDYRGAAIEPVVREAVERMLPDPRIGGGMYAGRYWTRTGDAEVDLVFGEQEQAPTPVHGVGSIKWRERKAFGRRDGEELVRAAARVPGVGGRPVLVGVSATGFDSPGLDVELGPLDLLEAWRPTT